MKLNILVGALALPFAMAGAAAAGDAVVPDEFEQQQAVDACDTYGQGFAKLPGTSTCMRVSGQVRFENRLSNRSSATGGRTQLDFETRSD